MPLSEEDKRKAEEKERRKAEVRARLEAQSQKSNKKKGFMTPERKKKLRMLLRKKAAEELKREQERKAEERRNVIRQRSGTPKNLDGANEAELQAILREYHKRLLELHGDKWELEYATVKKEFEINELSVQVNDLRGKFIKPPLRKVPRYGQKIEKMLLAARKEIGFTVQLKSVKKDKFKLEEDDKEKDSKPEWALKGQSAAQSAAQSGAQSEAED